MEEKKKGMPAWLLIVIIFTILAVVTGGVLFFISTSSQQRELDRLVDEVSGNMEGNYQVDELDNQIELCSSACKEKCEKMFPAKEDPNRPQLVAACVNSCTMSCSYRR